MRIKRICVAAIWGVAVAGGCAQTRVASVAATQGDGAVHATSLKSFEGIEEPVVTFHVTAGASTKPAAARDQLRMDGEGKRRMRIEGTFVSDDYPNILDEGEGVIRMRLRYRQGGPEGNWWDGDRATQSNDRQRAEVKGLGPHQKLGETFEYGTTWRTDEAFSSPERFCHVFQLKATNGDKGPPLVTMSIVNRHEVRVQYWSGTARGFTTARTFAWTPGTWETVRIRIRTATDATGEVLASVNGDAFSGATEVAIYRPDGDDYRPKWGLYRGVHGDMAYGDDWVEHKDVLAKKL